MSWLRFFTQPKAHVTAPATSAKALESRLVASIGWLEPAGAPSGPDEARRFLCSLPPQALFDIDQRLRSWASPAYRDWPADLAEQLASPDIDAPLRHAVLFLAASHHDGHLREAAVRTLADHPGYLTLAAALIRCADWAGPVRHAAETVVVQLLPRTEGEHVVSLWPLVLRLQSRERVVQAWLATRVEGWMLQPASRPRLRKLLGSQYAPTRAWAFRQVLEHDIDPGFDALTVAIRDPDPRIGLHALRFTARHSNERRQALAISGLQAAHPIIRRTSLHLLSGLDGGLSRDRLLGLLCDPSAGVRSLAAYLLRERHGEEAVVTWRTVLDADGGRAPLGALAALADHAQPQDVVRFQRWLADSSSLVRSAALRGMLAAGGRPDDDALARLLVQGGNRVRWLLQRHVRLGDLPLDAARVARLLTLPTMTSAARQDLQALALSSGHWPSLALLLHFPEGDDAQDAWWRDAVAAWAGISGRYAPLGAQTGAKLLLALDARRDDLSPDDYATIRSAIERH